MPAVRAYALPAGPRLPKTRLNDAPAAAETRGYQWLHSLKASMKNVHGRRRERTKDEDRIVLLNQGYHRTRVVIIPRRRVIHLDHRRGRVDSRLRYP